MPFKKGQSGNPRGAILKCRYDLRHLKTNILDQFGGLNEFCKFWYKEDKKYLSDFLKEFIKKEVKIEHKGEVTFKLDALSDDIKEMILELTDKK